MARQDIFGFDLQLKVGARLTCAALVCVEAVLMGD